MPPVEYDTMLTSVLKIKQLAEETGPFFPFFHLISSYYNYATEIQWTLPEAFPLQK